MKKLHVIFYKIASYLAKLGNKIGDKDIWLFNFWDELYDNKYFDDKNALIRIKYIKLTNNIYQIRVPVKNSYWFLKILLLKNQENGKKNQYLHF